MDFVDKIYIVTDSFPPDERFGLINQLRRASISIPSNIAEGFLRGSRKEYARFIRHAYGSAAEVDTQIEIAFRQKFISKDQHRELQDSLIEVLKMLNGLISKLKTNT